MKHCWNCETEFDGEYNLCPMCRPLLIPAHSTAKAIAFAICVVLWGIAMMMASVLILTKG